MIPERIAADIDPAYEHWLRATNVELPEGFEPTLEQMRGAFETMTAAVNNPIDQSISVENKFVPGRDGHRIPVRVYRHKKTSEPAPVCVFIHGGGWVLGNLETHNGLCGDIALNSGATVVAIDYRLSPEHQYPAALNDCEDVLQTMTANAAAWNIDDTRIALFGDSAGGNLATACSIVCVEKGLKLKAQVLVYPALAASMDAPSYTENADVPGLTVDDMAFFFRAYNGGDEPKGPLAAPLIASNVGGQPNTLISVAALDPLRDDGVMYAEKLENAGVSVTLSVEKSVGHSYLWLRHQSPIAVAAFTEQTDFLKSQLA